MSPNDEVTYYEPGPRNIPILKEEEASLLYEESEKHQPTVDTQQEKSLPRWVKQVYDDDNPLPISHEKNADRPRHSHTLEEQRRASANIVNMALMAEIMVETKEPTSLAEALQTHPRKLPCKLSLTS